MAYNRSSPPTHRVISLACHWIVTADGVHVAVLSGSLDALSLQGIYCLEPQGVPPGTPQTNSAPSSPASPQVDLILVGNSPPRSPPPVQKRQCSHSRLSLP